MKKIIALLLVLAIFPCLCSCSSLSPKDTITFNEDGSQLYYNGRTYINYRNNNGNYRLDADQLTEIATMPYGYFHIFGAVTVYYGNNAENPDFITETRGYSLFVREGLVFDHSLALTVRDLATPYSFTVSQVTSGQVLPYNWDQKDQYTNVCNFFVTYEEYPQISQWMFIQEFEGKLYLQDAWDSDYYEITDTFAEDIYRLGLDTFDYR